MTTPDVGRPDPDQIAEAIARELAATWHRLTPQVHPELRAGETVALEPALTVATVRDLFDRHVITVPEVLLTEVAEEMGAGFEAVAARYGLTDEEGER